MHVHIILTCSICLSYRVVRVVIFEYKCMPVVFEYKCMHVVFEYKCIHVVFELSACTYKRTIIFLETCLKQSIFTLSACTLMHGDTVIIL